MGKMVLLVDDSPIVLTLVKDTVENIGHTVVTNGSYREAMNSINSTKFDLILLDLNMPEVNGDEICKYVKTNDKTKNTPVYFLSMEDENKLVNLVEEAGAPGRLVSGDTLFLGSCGRVDLPGSDPEAMYRSLNETLKRLPDETLVYPGHLYSSEASGSLGNEKHTNPLLRVTSLDQFLMFMGA